MTDFFDILRAHAAKYPRMQPRDAVKLAYQSEFGGGHLITDPNACAAYVQQEYAQTARSSLPLLEDIGDDMVRVHLSALDAAGIAPAQVAVAFIACANQPQGSRAGLLEKLQLLRKAAGQGLFAFSPEALEAYLCTYAAEGYPAVSHSPDYRAAYTPAYRVMHKRYARILPLLAKLDVLCAAQSRVVLAIDGHAASGKTTLAAQLAEIYGENACVLHMDDFFLPPHLRTPERYAEPGGNLHYERFYEEVVQHLREDAVCYAPFDCSCGDFAAPEIHPLSQLVIVEGSYSTHPYFGTPYDLTVFLQLDSALQKARILQRNGPDWYQDFEEKWIPMENAYFEATDILTRSDMIL